MTALFQSKLNTIVTQIEVLLFSVNSDLAFKTIQFVSKLHPLFKFSPVSLVLQKGLNRISSAVLLSEKKKCGGVQNFDSVQNLGLL